jgi:hypothetical protein
MTPIDPHAESPESPFAALLRSSDRERILVQLMTSVWETILQLPILARDGHYGDEAQSGASWPRAFAAKCAAIMHGWEPEALTEAVVRDGWGEQVNMVGGNLKAPRTRGPGC